MRQSRTISGSLISLSSRCPLPSPVTSISKSVCLICNSRWLNFIFRTTLGTAVDIKAFSQSEKLQTCQVVLCVCVCMCIKPHCNSVKPPTLTVFLKKKLGMPVQLGTKLASRRYLIETSIQCSPSSSVVVSSSGYDMSTFIRRYSRYLNEKSFAYRQMSFDFVRVKKGWVTSLFSSLIWLLVFFLILIEKTLPVCVPVSYTSWVSIKGSHLQPGLFSWWGRTLAKCAALQYVAMQTFTNMKLKANKNASDWHWKAVGV